MALDTPALTDGLEALFSDPPDDFAACAQGWADAVQSCATGITPASPAVAAAATTLATALAAAFQLPSAPPAMETAFTAFAATVGAGMAGFVPVPPPAPVGFVAQFAGPHPETHADAADQLGSLIDAWLRTGTATPIGGGPAVPWS